MHIATKILSTDPYTVELTGTSAADADAVHVLLTRLDDHARWAGEQQTASFRLVTIDGPDRPLEVGDVFRSTGRIPTISRVWQDVSTVTAVTPGRTFAFRTKGTIDWSRARRRDLPPAGRHAGRGSFEHHYALEPDGDGTRVTYRFTQHHIENPPAALRWSALRAVTQRHLAPAAMARGLRNLLRNAEVVSARDVTAPAR